MIEQENTPYNMFADSNSYVFRQFQSFSQENRRFPKNEPTRNQSNSISDSQSHQSNNLPEKENPLQQKQQDQQPVQPHNFGRLYICLLKKNIKRLELDDPIQKSYLKYFKNKIKYSVTSLAQFLKPCPMNKQNNQDLEEKFIEKFELSNPNIKYEDFAQKELQQKKEIMKECKNSIKNYFLSKQDELIEMSKYSQIKDQHRKDGFSSFVERQLNELRNNRIKVKRTRDQR